jgi:hypothetical protein
VNGTSDRPKVVAEPPPVCPLCWGWILEGEAWVILSGEKAHRECYQKGEAD